MKKLLFLFLFLLLPVSVLAGNFGLTEAAQRSGLVATGASTGTGGLSEFIGQIIGTALSLIAIVFFILVLYGGITWMTARGNEEQTKKALNTITAAIIGLILIMASYAITSFVFDSITGQNSIDQTVTPVTLPSAPPPPAPAPAPVTPPSAPASASAPLTYLCSWEIDNFFGASGSQVVTNREQCLDLCRQQNSVENGCRFDGFIMDIIN